MKVWVGQHCTVAFQDSFSSEFRSALESHGLIPESHMRLGRYSVVICEENADVVVRETYAADDSAYRSIPKTSPFYEASKRDRLAQFARIEAALNTLDHPLDTQLRAEIARERATYE